MDSGDADAPDAPDAAPGPARAIEGRDAPGRSDSDRDRPAAPADLGDQQMAEHVRYRLSVEASYQAAEARGAWAEAALALRAQWDAHRARYPDREQRPATTQPDGSWQGDGGRRLSPEQNAEAAKCAADLRDEAAQRIRPAMERVEAADPSRRLAGLEHMVKGEDRLKEKLADELTDKPGITIDEALEEVADGVRFTLEYPSERYAEGVLADVTRIKAEGFQLIKLKNLWHGDQYKGVNSQWRAPETGTRCEIQFHTTESLDAKELTHKAYERIRGAEASPAERRELRDFQRQANGQLVMPPHTDKIKDFPETTEKSDA